MSLGVGAARLAPARIDLGQDPNNRRRRILVSTSGAHLARKLASRRTGSSIRKAVPGESTSWSRGSTVWEAKVTTAPPDRILSLATQAKYETLQVEESVATYAIWVWLRGNPLHS